MDLQSATQEKAEQKTNKAYDRGGIFSSSYRSDSSRDEFLGTASGQWFYKWDGEPPDPIVFRFAKSRSASREIRTYLPCGSDFRYSTTSSFSCAARARLKHES